MVYTQKKKKSKACKGTCKIFRSGFEAAARKRCEDLEVKLTFFSDLKPS